MNKFIILILIILSSCATKRDISCKKDLISCVSPTLCLKQCSYEQSKELLEYNGYIQDEDDDEIYYKNQTSKRFYKQIGEAVKVHHRY